MKCNVLQKMGAKTMVPLELELPEKITENGIKFHFIDDQGMAYANEPYIAVLPDGKELRGVTDNDGKTKVFYTDSPHSINVQLTRLV